MRYLFTVCCFLVGLSSQAVIRYVRPNVPNGNGLSWLTAYNDIQTAINASSANDEVWIAAGTYTPPASLFMKSGVKIYGGFAGNEGHISLRNWVTNVTAISGAGLRIVFNNDGRTINSAALLDGVTITSGAAAYGGAGMYNPGTAVPTLRNVIFLGNVAAAGGGGLYQDGGSPRLENVIFRSNRAGSQASGEGDGGGFFSDDASPVLINCVFQGNTAGRWGGAFYGISYGTVRLPVFTNVLFTANLASGRGGAMYLNNIQPTINNCTFVRNGAGQQGGSGGIHNANQQSTKPLINNSIFWRNYYSSPTTLIVDLVNDNSNSAPDVFYSAFSQNSPPVGTGILPLTANDPFVNGSSPTGPDGLWFTADDGLRLRYCYENGLNPLIDKGRSYPAGTVPTDILGQNRAVNTPWVPNGGPEDTHTVDLGAYEQQDQTTIEELVGSIGNPHTVPVPQELFPDFVTSVVAPAPGMTVSWQQNNGSGWTLATGLSPTDSVGFRLPALNHTTNFRRAAKAALYCNVDFTTSPVAIKVVEPNGAIMGKVTGKNSTSGVQGITLSARRLGTHNPGTPPDYTYTAITGLDGSFTIQPVYYGDPSLQTVPQQQDSFEVVPSKPGHSFDKASLKVILTRTVPQVQNVNFTDTTVFSITGRVFQQCNECNAPDGAPQVQVSPLDSVTISTNRQNVVPGTTGFIDTAFGRYVLSVPDQGNITLTPQFKNHVFVPVNRTLNVTGNFSGIDFQDTTTRVITGRLSSGCDQFIGNAVLLFSDVLPNDKDGNPRASTFLKRVHTNPGSGFFSVRLPARKYKVAVVGFTPADNNSQSPAYINPQTLMQFINAFPADSLTRDITERDTVLNLRYERPPVLELVGLPIVCNAPSSFAQMRQEVLDSFTVKAFQGHPTFDCPVRDTNKIRLFTSVHKPNNTSDELRFALTDSGALVKLKGGSPNIIAPYLKDLNIQFTDRFGRQAASINRNVLVTGVKADEGTPFTTVSPQVPLLVLHDPPGDASYSFFESSQSVQTALRLYAAKGNSVAGWVEAKLGTAIETGLGVSIESSVWGTINNELSVESANTTANETILTTTTMKRYETSSSPDVVGGDGDLYVGAALNLLYAPATEIKLSGCGVTSNRTIVVANKGFSTNYMYTEGYIRNDLIPELLDLAANATVQAERERAQNQVKVWQQVLENNAANKARAKFEENRSFEGSAGPYTDQTTSSVSNTQSVEFNMTIDNNLAISLGFEVGGSGASGGVNVAFRMETGSSKSTTITRETTVGYVLDDDDPNDDFSVNIKTDPVYNTPVFELVAGKTSCPVEAGTQPRDEVELRVPVPAVSGVTANGDAVFELFVGNTSPSLETRSYLLSFDPTSNPDAAIITVGGIPVVAPFQYTVEYGKEAKATVNVKKNPGKDVFSYEGLRFTVTDLCGGQSKAALLSAYFVNNCSGVTLGLPEEGWVLAAAANNLLPVVIKGYNKSSLTSVTLEYSRAGNSNWVEGFTRTAAQLDNNGVIGTPVSWNVSALADGDYNLRLKLVCPSGTVYSNRVSGTIDRKAPDLFGRPTPTNEVFVFGDVISFTYNEALDVTNLGAKPISLRRLSNNQLIPVTVTGYENKIVITPDADLSPFALDSFRVVVGGLTDRYGNLRTKNDTSGFVVSSFTPATGANALTVSILKPRVFKNADSAMEVYFNLPVKAPNDIRVNYFIAGTARFGQDYTVQYDGLQANFASFNGMFGTLQIPKDSTRVRLRLLPVKDSIYKPDHTVIISLMDGGDYRIGASKTVLGTITSEDGVMVYTFTGNGNFSQQGNWEMQKRPMTVLPPGKQIIINPSGTCIMNMPLTIAPGATLTVKEGKQLIVNRQR